jgi:hypothetical protein
LTFADTKQRKKACENKMAHHWRAFPMRNNTCAAWIECVWDYLL